MRIRRRNSCGSARPGTLKPHGEPLSVMPSKTQPPLLAKDAKVGPSPSLGSAPVWTSPPDPEASRRPRAPPMQRSRRDRRAKVQPLSGDSRPQVGGRRRPIRGQGSRLHRQAQYRAVSWRRCLTVQTPTGSRALRNRLLHMQERSSAYPGAGRAIGESQDRARRGMLALLTRIRCGRADDRNYGQAITLSGGGGRLLSVESDRADVAERTLGARRLRASRGLRVVLAHWSRSRSSASGRGSPRAVVRRLLVRAGSANAPEAPASAIAAERQHRLRRPRDFWWCSNPAVRARLSQLDQIGSVPESGETGPFEYAPLAGGRCRRRAPQRGRGRPASGSLADPIGFPVRRHHRRRGCGRSPCARRWARSLGLKRCRLAEPKALAVGGAELAQLLGDGLIRDVLGDRRQADAVGHVQDGFDDETVDSV